MIMSSKLLDSLGLGDVMREAGDAVRDASERFTAMQAQQADMIARLERIEALLTGEENES